MNERAARRPIGIFDSGIGGLTVARAISALLPDEQLIYFGDTAHLPYGEKSPEAIQHYSLRICDLLLEKDCKLIVIACNSASAAAYKTLRNHLGGKALLVNVIDPVVEYVTEELQMKHVGVIGTKATIRSNIYEHKLKAAKHDITVASLATPLLAGMIEEGFFHNNISKTVIQTYLSSLIADIEGLILACTHYPLIKPEITEYYGDKIKVIDTPDVVAREVKRQLEAAGLLSPGRKEENVFYVSDLTDSFRKTTTLFYGENVRLEHLPLWEE